MHSLTKCRIIEQVVHASQRGTIWSAYWGKIWTGVVMVGIFDLIFFQKILFLSQKGAYGKRWQFRLFQ